MSSNLVLGNIGALSALICLFGIYQKIKLIKKEAFLNAFSDHPANVYIPDVDDIENDTFVGCILLQSLDLPGIDYSNKKIFGSDTDKNNLELKTIILHNCYNSSGSINETKLGTCFSNLKNLREISLPDSLYTFDSNSLAGCINLKSLILKNKVKISNNAFYNITNLEELQTTIPEEINTLGINSLVNLNSLSVLKYNGDTTYLIKNNTFKNTSSLKNIYFLNYGENLYSIAENSFENINNINEVNLSNSNILNIPSNAFKNCANLNVIYVKKNTLTSINENAFIGNVGSISVIEDAESPVAYNSIKHMYPHGANRLYLLRFKYSTLTAAEPSAFMNVNISDNKLIANELVSFGEYSFSHMGNLSSVSINTTTKFSIPLFCFANNNNLLNIFFGNNIIGIDPYSFNSSYLSSITLDDLHPGLQLKDYALENLYNLKEIPWNKIYSVGNSALKNCNLLQYTLSSLELISSIGENGFENAILVGDTIDKLNLNSEVFKHLGKNAFKGCKLKAFYCGISLKKFNEDLSPLIPVDTLIPDPLLDKNKIIEKYNIIREYFGIDASSPFELILKDFTYNNTGGGNDYQCFEYDESNRITNVIETEDLKIFKKYPIIPSKAIEIVENAFNYGWFKDDLSAIYTNNVTAIGDRVLNNCGKLNIFNGDQLQRLGIEALANCNILSTLDAKKLVFIGDRSLYNCCQLTSINFPKLTSIGEDAFSECNKVQEVKINSIKNIGLNAFNNMTSLKSADLGVANDGTLDIPEYCFNNCTNLDSILLPPIVHSIKLHALKNAGSISSSKCNLSVTFIGKNQNEIESILPLDNNNIESKVGTKFFSNDFSYHAFLTESDTKIYKVKNKAFLVEKEGSTLVLKLIDNSRFPYQQGKIEVEDLTGLHIAAYAAKGCSNIITIYLNEELTSNIDINAFALTNGLELIDISINYEDNDDNRSLYLAWTDFDLRVSYKFNNGILFYDSSYSESGLYPNWHFNSSTDVFNEFPKGRIHSVNDGRVNSTGIEEIPLKYNTIGAGSLSTTIKINTLDAGNNILSIEDFAFKDNYSIENFNIKSDDNLNYIGESAFIDCCIKSIDIPYNSNRLQIKGYGLNTSYFLNELKYETGASNVEVTPSAMIECRPLLEKVTLPTNTTRIGEYAFAEMKSFHPAIRSINLDKLTLLTSIDDYAFYNSLVTVDDSSIGGKKLIIPKNVKTIGAAAFGYNSDAIIQELSGIEFKYYEDVDIQGKLQSIGPSAFIRNYFRDIKLYSGTKKSKLSSIGDYAFAYPKNKFNICIPSSIRHIGVGAFKKNVILNPMSVLKNILSVDLDTTKEILCVMYDPTAPASCTLCSLNDNYEAHNSISATDDTIFLATKGNYHTSFIYVSNNKLNVCPDNLSIDIINRKVLLADHSIISAFIPSYIYTIGEGAFSNCTELTSISSINKYLNIESSAFYNCQKLLNINGPLTFNLSVVNPYSFYDCRSLSNILILSDAISVGECAFYNCSSITSFLEIDQTEKRYYTLSVIESSAFMNCTGISSFFIPSNLSILGNDVFKGCYNIEKLTVNITTEQFRNVADSVYKLSSVGELVRDKFFNIREDGKCVIIFNDAVYMNTGDVKIDNEYVDFRDDLSTIISAFDYQMFLKDKMSYLNLSNISEVDPFVFRGAEDLDIINFLPGEKHLTSIGDYAFSKCSYLASINANLLSVVEVGKYAFANCNLIYKMTFDGDAIEKIGQGAFYSTSIEQLIFEVDFNGTDRIADDYLIELKRIIDWNEELNHNPLELPVDSIIIFRDKTYRDIRGKYDYMLNDLMKSDIDINRNLIVYIDKRVNAIKPLLLIKPGKGLLPAIVNNKFHMNVIGRWK